MNFTGLPRMAKIRQKFRPQTIADIRSTVRQEFTEAKVADVIKPGQSVAVTAGSRGINNISLITRSLVDELKNIDAAPFIVPAMGSHGGATAEGQKKLLSTLGITEESMGVPIRSSMEVVEVGTIETTLPVYIDKYSYQADHIFVVNRIKPHTDFEGEIESGLMKMIAIGLGKQKSADGYHNQFMLSGHEKLIAGAARVVLDTCNIVFGLGIVENEIDETQKIEIVPADRIEEREKELLVLAKNNLPRLPFDNIDLLIVDEIGKHISGTGMDQNVIARTVVPFHVVPDKPTIRRIFVRDIDPRSGGNGLGIGNADFTTSRFVECYDRSISYMNSITAACPEITRIPTYFDNDRAVIGAAFMTIPIVASSSSRVVWIRNTLNLEEMYISEAMLDEVERNSLLEMLGDVVEVQYDKMDNLVHPKVE